MTAFTEKDNLALLEMIEALKPHNPHSRSQLMATLTKKDNAALLAQVEALKPPPLNRLQRLVRQKTFTRTQSTVSNFQLYYVRARRTMPAVTTLPIVDLIAMLDKAHPAGSKFAVVSKPTRSDRKAPRFRNLTAVLDVANNRLYRANHETGMVTFWKRLAKNRSGFVQYVGTGEVFDPRRPPPAKKSKPAPVFKDGLGQVIDVAWTEPAPSFTDGLGKVVPVGWSRPSGEFIAF